MYFFISYIDFWLIRVKRTFHTPFSFAERSSCVGVTAGPSELGPAVTLTQDGNEPKIRSILSYVCAMKKNTSSWAYVTMQRFS